MDSESGPRKLKGFTYAITSGLLACLAGTVGKFAINKGDTLWYCETICTSYLQWSAGAADSYCDQKVVQLRVLAFFLMMLVNVFMLTTFLKALRFCHTSLEATVTNTAANFFASGFVGRLLFNESMTLLTWLGTLFILFGFGLMTFSSKGGTLKGLLSRGHRKRKTR